MSRTVEYKIITSANLDGVRQASTAFSSLERGGSSTGKSMRGLKVDTELVSQAFSGLKAASEGSALGLVYALKAVANFAKSAGPIGAIVATSIAVAMFAYSKLTEKIREAKEEQAKAAKEMAERSSELAKAWKELENTGPELSIEQNIKTLQDLEKAYNDTIQSAEKLAAIQATTNELTFKTSINKIEEQSIKDKIAAPDVRSREIIDENTARAKSSKSYEYEYSKNAEKIVLNESLNINAKAQIRKLEGEAVTAGDVNGAEWKVASLQKQIESVKQKTQTPETQTEQMNLVKSLRLAKDELSKLYKEDLKRIETVRNQIDSIKQVIALRDKENAAIQLGNDELKSRYVSEQTGMNLSEKLSRERYDQEQAKAREQADKKAADEKNKADIKAGQDAIAAKKEQAASVGQSADLYEKKTAVAEQAVVSQSTIVHDPNARRFADQSEREAKRQATREAAREANLEKLSQKRGLRGKALDDYDALKNKRENAAFFKEKATQKRSEEAVLLDDIKTAIKNLSDKAEVLGTG